MINFLAKNQNWAKITPLFGVVSLYLLFHYFGTSSIYFWALINIPLYMFHQTEEHFIPGGFKDFMNKVVIKQQPGEEKLTDIKIFWINILMVWLAFIIFGSLSFINIGFGLFIIVFSIMNCLTHIAEGFKRKSWNPGLVMASIQFCVSLFAAYFVSTNGLNHIAIWWLITIVFSILAHILLFKLVMTR